MFLLENRTAFSVQVCVDLVCCSGAKIKPVVSTHRCSVAMAMPTNSSESVIQKLSTVRLHISCSGPVSQRRLFHLMLKDLVCFSLQQNVFSQNKINPIYDSNFTVYMDALSDGS